MDKRNIIIGLLGLAVVFLLIIALAPGDEPSRVEEQWDTFPEAAMLRTSTVDPQQQPDNMLEQKIIYTGQLEIEVENIEEVGERITTMVEEKGGYISESRFWEHSDGAQKNARLVLRIPAEVFDSTLARLGALGRILDQSTRAQDITEQYYDLEARLDNKKRQEKRYLEILDMAAQVEEILKVERELERIRGEIESMEGRMRYYEDRISLATITILAQETHTPSAVLATLKEALSSLGESFQGMIVFAATVVPWAVVIVLIGWVLVSFWGRKSD